MVPKITRFFLFLNIKIMFQDQKGSITDFPMKVIGIRPLLLRKEENNGMPF